MGEQGELKFQAYLIGLDWMAERTPSTDRGTDVFAFVDPTGRGQVAALAFQVKTTLAMTFVHRRRDNRRGYTYRETGDRARRHLEYWANIDTPHYLIVQTLDERVRLWQRLDRQSIRATPKGFEVFLPEDQAVGAEAPEEWLEVARRRAGLAYESVSRGEIGQGPPVAPEDELRFALMVPRLVAAHPNLTSTEGFGPGQAVAACSMGTIGEWHRRAKPGSDVPDPESACEHAVEAWRFAGAVALATSGGSTELLESLAWTASAPPVRAAGRALLTARAIEDADIPRAQSFARADDDFSPEDAHWLAVLGIGIHESSGDTDEAQAAITRGYERAMNVRSDPTTRQLNATLYWADYRRHWRDGTRSVPKVVATSDHAARWWRNQHFTGAFESSTKRLFDTWSSTRTVRFGGEFQAHNELFAAIFQAYLGGSLDEARNAQSVLARIDLMTIGTSGKHAADALKGLLLSGDKASLTDALRRSTTSAPESALDGLLPVALRALNVVPLKASAVAALRAIGPYLSVVEAKQARGALIESIIASDRLVYEQVLSSTHAEDALRACAEMDTELEPSHAERLVQWVMRRDPDDSFDDRAANAAAILFLRHPLVIPDTLRNEVLTSIATTSAATRKYWALVSVIGLGSPEGRELVALSAAEGDEVALLEGASYDDYTVDQQRAFLRKSLDQLAAQRERTPSPGMVSRGSIDYGRRATTLAIILEDSVAVDAIYQYIESPSVQLHDKRGALMMLAHSLRSHSWIDRAALVEAARAARLQRDEQLTRAVAPDAPELGGAPEYALLASRATEPSETAECVSRLIRGTTTERSDLCRALSVRTSYDLVLATLADSDHFDVRLAAAESSAFALLTRTCETDVLIGALKSAVTRGGVETRKRVWDILDSLHDHPEVAPGLRLRVEAVVAPRRREFSF